MLVRQTVSSPAVGAVGTVRVCVRAYVIARSAAAPISN